MNKIRKEIIDRLEKEGLIVNALRVWGYNRETGSIRSVRVSLGDIDTGENVLYKVKAVLDQVEHKYNLNIRERLVEF